MFEINKYLNFNYTRTMQNSVMIEKQAASNPVLLSIVSVINTFSKQKHVVYYEIPAFHKQYRNIEEIQEILLTNKLVKFKILDLDNPDALPTYQQARVVQKEQFIFSINLSTPQGQIKIEGKPLNRASTDGVVFSATVKEVCGYQTFMKFRHKYRTLENVTRKQEFKLDHRMKIIDGNQKYFFSLDQGDQSQIFFSSRKIKLQIQQVFMIDDWELVEMIHEEQIDLTEIVSSSDLNISLSGKLQVILGLQMICNSNFASTEMASLRILEVYPNTNSLSLGTDRFNQIATIHPLMQDKYYDYEYGYLNKNLKQVEGTSVYDHLSKLTSSSQSYPHFQNSNIIQVLGAKYFVFIIRKDGRQQKIHFPFVYVLQGFNIIHSQQYTVKFFIQFSGQTIETSIKSQDSRRFCELRLKDIWNLGPVVKQLKNFDLKIISQHCIQRIPFKTQNVDMNTFKKQQKQLSIKSQYGEMNQNKYYLITRPADGGKNKLLLCKADDIQQLYLVDLFSSSPITFQICTKDQIYLQASILRSKLLSDTRDIRVILVSADHRLKVVLNFQINKVTQKNDSIKTCYKILHCLEFTDNNPCDDVQYDLAVSRASDKKVTHSKVWPEMKEDGVSSLRTIDDIYYSPFQNNLDFVVSLRKMHYNELTEVFDNEEILNKRIIVNACPQQVLQKQCMLMVIKQEGFSSIDLDFYDDNIKKRLKLHLSVLMVRNSHFDMDTARYVIKIPQLLWHWNNWVPKGANISIEAHLSKRNKKDTKISVFPDSPQEYFLPFYNYKDGISVKIGDEIGYCKVMDCMKLRCDIVKNTIGWIEDSEWTFCLININSNPFHFLIKTQYISSDSGGDQSDGSVKSHKTKGKQKSEYSNGHKIDPLAKTVRNMDIINLKKMRNNLADESRQLTTKYVKKQEKIITLTKKIQQIQEALRKKKAEQSIISHGKTQQITKKPQNKQKMTQFYRSICQCGARNPKFNGYCEQCLKKLKKRYQQFYKQYSNKSLEYQRMYFNKFNSKQKMIQARNKLKNYKEKLKMGQSIDDGNITDIIMNLQQKDIRREIEEYQIQIFRLEEERQKIQDSGKLRQSAIQELIRKEELQIWEGSQQMHSLEHRLEDLLQKIDDYSKS